MNSFHIFVIRAVLGGILGVILSRFFYPDAKIQNVMALGVLLVGLAYFAEFLRNRKSR